MCWEVNGGNVRTLSALCWRGVLPSLAVLVACGVISSACQEQKASIERAADGIKPEAIRARLEFLADDALEGRGTGTRGHKLAVKYLRAELEAFGLRPGAGSESYFQTVPLVRTIVEEKGTSFVLRAGKSVREFLYGTDYVMLDTHRDTEASATADVIFVGYGVTAPELGYDDYAGLPVRGKIVAMLGFESPASFPPTLRAYYTDHTVKRANAASHGAIGILYLRSPALESRWPWSGVSRELQGGWNSSRWVQADGRPGGLDDTLRVFGMLNRSGAEALFDHEKFNLAEVFASLERGKPPRFALSKSASITFHSRHKRIDSDNVVAILDGTDPVLKSEYVLYCAHVDHLGISAAVKGDSIYNGAMDNAGGCSVLLEVARAFAASPDRPKRSIVFLFVTGEEIGFLGSGYFACNPTIPLSKIVAVINVDGGTALTPITDVIAWGAEHSSLQTIVQQAAAQTGFTVSPDPFPEEGFFVRSDQISFVTKGIPSVFIDVGVKSANAGVDGLSLIRQWMVTKYHSPEDDLTQPIDYDTSVRFAHLLVLLGHSIATDSARPHWNAGDFFAGRFGDGDR
jgi:hypothetical protein